MLQAGALRVGGEEGRQGEQSIKKHLSTSLTEISSSPNPGEGEGRSETEVAGGGEGENTCREGELTEGQGRVGKPVFRSQSARYISVLILLTIYWGIFTQNCSFQTFLIQTVLYFIILCCINIFHF